MRFGVGAPPPPPPPPPRDQRRELERDARDRLQRRFLPRPAVEVHHRDLPADQARRLESPPTLVMPLTRATGIASLSL